MTDRSTIKALAARGAVPEFRAALRATGNLSPSSRLALEFILAVRSGDFAAARAMLTRLVGEPPQVRQGIVSTLKTVPERSESRSAAMIDGLIAALEVPRQVESVTASRRRTLPAAVSVVLGAVGILVIGVLIGLVIGNGSRSSGAADGGSRLDRGAIETETRESVDASSGSDTAGDAADSGYGVKDPKRPAVSPTPPPSSPPVDPPQPPPPASAPAPPSDPDSDADGKPDATDPCPEFPKESAVDGDGDGVPDDCDNCPKKANPRGPDGQQADGDGDGVGDACDNCPLMATDNTGDTDNDGVGDECECDGASGFDPARRGMKGRDCDDWGNPLPGSGRPPRAAGAVAFSKPSEVGPAVERLIKAWKSKETGPGSERECETLDSALSTFAAVLELLATESGKGREEVKKVIARFRSVTDAKSKRMIKADALRLLAELEGGPIRDMSNSCNKLLDQVLARSPDACLGDDPIVKFGLDTRMAEIVGEVHELGNRNYRFAGDRSMPRKWLQAADGPINQMGTKWKDLIGDARREVDPPPGYKPAQ